MYSVALLGTVFAALASAMPPSSRSARKSASCASGAHIIVSRGSIEPPGEGLLGTVARQVQERIPGSDIAALDYPAQLDPYNPSETTGVNNLAKVVNSYAKECPETKMILMGYSQGAMVTADVLCGASEDGFPSTNPVEACVADKVAAVILMGDPSRTSNETFNRGTSRADAIFPRQNVQGCNRIAHKTVSYCDTNDRFCVDGGESLAVHLSYVPVYGDDAANFAVAMYEQEKKHRRVTKGHGGR